jgi:hypothetical protein
MKVKFNTSGATLKLMKSIIIRAKIKASLVRQFIYCKDLKKLFHM